MTISPDVLPEVIRADHVAGPPQGQWTYAEYAAIPDDGNRYEVIDGVLYMAPSPTVEHQDANGGVYFYLRLYVKDTGLGRVFHAALDVELAPKAIVQPDVFVILKANQTIIEKGKIKGVPDLVVEVASPGTAGYDRRDKQNTYERFGVPEYWIVDPATETIQVLSLEQGAYRSLGVFQGKALLPSKVVPNLPVRVEQFFA
jgi:Uma2 family endonuclease